MDSRLPAWLFFFALMLAALAAGAWLGATSVRGLFTAYRSHAWNPTPCFVSRSELRPPKGFIADRSWSVRATCTYQAGGLTHEVNCSPHLTGSKQLVDLQIGALQVNSEHLCYVNPSDPADAIYGDEQSYLTPLVFLLVGALFMVIGGSGAVFLVKNGTS